MEVTEEKKDTKAFPFYWDAVEKLKNIEVHLTDEQQDQRAKDREFVKAMDDYYSPYRGVWRNSGALFNLIQNGTDDVSSNWYLGWSRILINHSRAMVTAGDPKGAFAPRGNHDPKMSILVSALVEDTINQCNWRPQQRLWIQDLHTMGNGTTESYLEMPMKKSKYMRGEKMIEKVVRDFKRSKAGIRRKSPFRTMRSHFISDPDDVPFSVDTEEGTWNQLAMKYGNVFNYDGTRKYDLSQIPVGSHYFMVKLYDELENCYRMYCTSYGGKPESTMEQRPQVFNLGAPIFDKPLSHFQFIQEEKVLTGGANPVGMSPLAFATFEDQLDTDMETYSTVGMGIPQIIAGPESVMHGLVNMSIDRERLAGTVPISYEPNSDDSPSAMDLDVRTMYSGLVVDGKITPMPMGTSGAGSNQVMWDWLKFVIYQLTGINPEGLTGDALQTAYQSGILQRQMNMRAKERISAWENGPLKRAWTVLGANALACCTEEEWEEITEEDAKRFQESISKDNDTAEDYRTVDEGGEKVHQKRVHHMIPVKGHKFRENFTGKNKKRTLNANTTDNTLIEDPSMDGDTSWVPADKNYLFREGDVQTVFKYAVKVDGSGMLQDLKTQDMEMSKGIITNAASVAALNPNDPTFMQSLDQKKIFLSSIEPTGKGADDVFKVEAEKSPALKAFEAASDQMDKENMQSLTQPENVEQNQGMVPNVPAQGGQVQTNGSTAAGQSGESGRTPSNNTAAALGSMGGV